MPTIKYQDINFRESTLAVIEKANEIISEYREQGFDLTLRQLYYQFVARDLIPNRDTEYKKLGDIVANARLAGLIDWSALVDRTRFLRDLSHWDDPAGVISSAAASYRIDLWERQEYRPEVWIEKDALVGVIEGVCQELDVPHFSCRGYTSISEMWQASQRICRHINDGYDVRIFHLGDHDPSGIDMSRDIGDRLRMFIERHVGRRKASEQFDVTRIALNVPQIEEYQPPPNPAKQADSRWQKYVDTTGVEDSWELDALDPTTLSNLIRENIESLIDSEIKSEDERRMTEERSRLQKTSEEWSQVSEFVNSL